MDTLRLCGRDQAPPSKGHSMAAISTEHEHSGCTSCTCGGNGASARLIVFTRMADTWYEQDHEHC